MPNNILASTHIRATAGFTLIEILIVMIIIGILATLGMGNFQSSQIKSRDARRKSDLENLHKSLEAYYNDKGLYPESSSGKIKGCGTKTAGDINKTVCDWGEALEESVTGVTQKTIYMVKLPSDPKSNYTYYYETAADRSWYKLYARLENTEDSDLNPAAETVNCGAAACNYVVGSSNVAL